MPAEPWVGRAAAATPLAAMNAATTASAPATAPHPQKHDGRPVGRPSAGCSVVRGINPRARP